MSHGQHTGALMTITNITTKTWAPILWLSSLSSPRNWGIGDFTDLKSFAAQSIKNEAAGVFLHPLQPIAFDGAVSEKELSFHSSRFLESAYIDIENVLEFDESPEVQRLVYGPEFQGLINEAKEKKNVDIETVRNLKTRALDLLFNQFRKEHLLPNTWRADQFNRFVLAQKNLHAYALYAALIEDRQKDTATSEQDWNEKYGHFDSNAVADYERQNYERVQKQLYIQWVAHLQLIEVQELFLASPNPRAQLFVDVPQKLTTNSFNHWFDKDVEVEDGEGQEGSDTSKGTSEAGVVKTTPENEGLESIASDSIKYYISQNVAFLTRRPISQEFVESILQDIPYKSRNLTYGYLKEGDDSKSADCSSAEVFVRNESGKEEIQLFCAADILTREESGESTPRAKNIVIGSPFKLDLLKPFLKSAGKFSKEFENAADSKAVIPNATYRLQMNKDFTFNHALEIVPYLESLGISHVYLSPIFKARPGSMHGYDIVNHRELNPEIGTQEEFDQLAQRLRVAGMGIILDIVPNHMGIGKDNPWWSDILENGHQSKFADYFDIDWQPLKPELRQKVTLPILGGTYGQCLTSGELKVVFVKNTGRFELHYYDHSFPIKPVSYVQLMDQRLDVLRERCTADSELFHEYKSVLNALRNMRDSKLPPEDLEFEQNVQIERLKNICARNTTIQTFIRENLELYNINPEDSSRQERMHSLLQEQSYRLVYWRVANDEINYRRFFDVNELAALRIEDPRVFAETHSMIFKFIADKKIDGIRIDHPDGLYDPEQYFSLLQDKVKQIRGLTETENNKQLPFYVIVEKILAPYEHLEKSWKVQGTTGYEYLNELLGLYVKSENEAVFEELYRTFAGDIEDLPSKTLKCKEIILETVLASELNVLVNKLSRIAESSWYYRDITQNALRQALKAIVAEFPTYRTYISQGNVDATALSFINWATGRARKNTINIDDSVINFVREVLTLEVQKLPGSTNEVRDRDFQKSVETLALKFQQFTGPVMAKSVEDTLFYRHTAFIALNEVGGAPEKFGSTIRQFHKRNINRSRQHPHSMLSTSTHDTKRSEDVRARLAVISELPVTWEQKVNSWARMNRTKKSSFADGFAPDAIDEYFVYQTLVGSYPVEKISEDIPALEAYTERMCAYFVKATKEAKRHSSWLSPNSSYEKGIDSFLRSILAKSSSNLFLSDLEIFSHKINSLGLINSLSQIVLKLTCPGVPDIYQGTELWDFSLVDPDNRRKVDFSKRHEIVKELDTDMKVEEKEGEEDTLLNQLVADSNNGQLKLFVLKQLLNQRKHNSDLFNEGSYIPLEVHGAGQEHLFAFARIYDRRSMIVVAPRMIASLLKLDELEEWSRSSITDVTEQRCWAETTINLPETLQNTRYINSLNKHDIQSSHSLTLSEIFKELPLAVLFSEET